MTVSLHFLHTYVMHHTKLHDRRIELTLFDPKNARAVSALLPEAFVRQIEALWSTNSDLLSVGGRELQRRARVIGKPLSAVDHQLRLQFWFEYQSQQENPDHHYPALNMSKVIGKAVSKEAFYKHVLTDPIRLAYILTPPENYLASLEFVLDSLNNKVLEIMELPLVKKSGEVDYTLINTLSRVMERFHRYVRSLSGDIVNASDKDGKSRGTSMSKKKIEEAAPPESASDRETRLKIEIEELEKQAREQQMIGQGESSGGR